MGTRETWVGLFFFVGLFLLIILSMRVDDEGHVFGKGYERQFRAVMPEIGTVGQGSIVRMAGTGIRIGRVDKVKLQEVSERVVDGEKVPAHYEFELTFSVKNEVNGLEVEIKTDSEARLAMTTLLQGMHLEITPGTPGADDLKPGETLITAKSTSLMDALTGLGDVVEGLGEGGLGRMLLGANGYEDIGEILDNLASDGGLGKWVMGEAAYKNLDPTVADLRKTVENVRKGTEGESTVARLIHDEDLGRRVDETITDLREGVKGIRTFATDISEGKGVIARLAKDEELGQKLDDIVTDIREVTADLREGKSLLARLISDEAMGEKLDSAVGSLADFAQNLATGEGTIARLINDPELFTEVKRLVFQAREAVEDAREAAPISAFTSVLFGAIQ